MSPLHWTKAAIAHHIKSYAIVSELLVTGCAIYFLAASSEPMSLARLMLYPGITGLLLGGMVAYRRAILCRSEKSHVDVHKLSDTRSFLVGEIVASLLITGGLTSWVLVSAGLCYPELVTAHPYQVAAGFGIILLAAVTAITLQYLFSGLCFRTDMVSVVAIVAIVLGASRTALADEVHRALDHGAGVGRGISDIVLAIARVVFPPLEELIKSAMYGVTRMTAWYLVQCAVYAAIVAWVAALLVRRSVRAAAPDGATGRHPEQPSPRASKTR